MNLVVKHLYPSIDRLDPLLLSLLCFSLPFPRPTDDYVVWEPCWFAELALCHGHFPLNNHIYFAFVTLCNHCSHAVLVRVTYHGNDKVHEDNVADEIDE